MRLALLLVLLALEGGGCERLNPAWCARVGRCPPGSRCDPATNSCVPLTEAGLDRAYALELPLPPPDGTGRDRAAQPEVAPTCLDGRICEAGAVASCSEAGASGRLRLCPLEACAAGHCLVPAGAKDCTTHQVCPQAPQLWVCTWLLEGGSTPRQVCAPAVPGQDGPESCQADLDCATGLCTAGSRCYQACAGDLDCSPLHCLGTTVNIEGVEKAVTSCM